MAQHELAQPAAAPRLPPRRTSAAATIADASATPPLRGRVREVERALRAARGGARPPRPRRRVIAFAWPAHSPQRTRVCARSSGLRGEGAGGERRAR